MNGLEKLELIGKIGRKLQEAMTFTDIKSYFAGHGIDYSAKKTSPENSKWVYTKEILADESTDKIKELAIELGLLDEQVSKTVVKNQGTPASAVKKTNKTRVFISHAAKDKALADAFCDLLETGLGISSEEIFCSSLPGQGIPAGEHFVGHIKEQLMSAEHVIFLISPNFMESRFCQHELGGTWTKGTTYTPFAVNPTLRQDIRDILTGVQILRINESDDLDEFEADIKKKLQISGKETPQWNRKKQQFLEQANIIMKELPGPTTISSKKYEEVLKELEDYKKALKKIETDLNEKDELISKLKNEKPGTDRQSALLKSLPITKSFDEVTKLIKGKMRKIDSVTREAIYYFWKQELFYPAKDYDGDSVKDAEDRKLVRIDEGKVSLNEENPQISEILDELSKLDQVLSDSKEASAFCDDFAEKHKYYPEMDNKNFWEDYLGL